TTTVSASPNPSTPGQTVAFTATIAPQAATPGVPAGMVTFTEGNVVLAQLALINGVAAFSTSALGAGAHAIQATYYSDSTFASSSGVVTKTEVVSTPPTADSVAPNGGAGTSSNFVFKYSSVNSYSYLNVVYALINGSLSATGGCVSYYLPASKALYLYNDAGTAVTGPLTPGLAGTLSNGQCTIDGPTSSAVGAGNTLSLTLSVAFSSSFKGLQTLFGYAADNSNLNSGWRTLGSWTSGTVVNSPPTVDSVNPNAGSNTSQNFTFRYSSPNGNNYLGVVYALINGSLSATGGCFAYYVPASKALYLYNDAGTGLTGPLTPGGSGSLSNGQCTIDGPTSSALPTGNTLALTLATAFSSSFKGSQTLFGYAADNANLNSGWRTLGTWTSGTVVNSPPTVDSVNPNAGSNTRQNFTFRYSSPNGNNYLNIVYALINGSLSATGGCFAYYVPASKALYLYNDAGTGLTGPLTPGGSGSLSNSQCTIDGPTSSAPATGNTLALTLAVAFNANFKGVQTLYGYTADNGNLNSGWQTLGTWTSGTLINSPPTADSVNPSTGAGASQHFVFKYSSVNGYNYLNVTYALINGSLNGAKGCFAYYVPGSKALYLYDDAGTAVTGPLTPGGLGSLSNNQCTINAAASSAVGAGNTLSLTLAVSFTSFHGIQTLYGYAADNSNLNSGWQSLGTWTAP
ncbi:MAG: Ig-like domain-containing protein, partial [Acidobacteriota bacterium]|nr:Ig-like domain-containing protein [Acidobacteriota bacterium]